MVIEFSDSALVKVRPDIDPTVVALQGEIVGLLKYAEARVINADSDAKAATEDLSLISNLKKAIAKKRNEWLTPIKEKLDAVDGVFKSLSTPLDQADKITRNKITAYRQEQERKAREAEEINRLRMEAARKEMELKGELTESVNLVEVVPVPRKTIRTEVGSAGMRDNWKLIEITDFTLLPDEYKIADVIKLGKVIRAGLHNIPGCKIENQPIIAITTH